MAGKAYLAYSNRTVTKRAGGRYDLVERWIVPEIESTGGGNDEPELAWQNEALLAEGLPEIGDQNQDGGYVCISLTPRSLDSQGMAYVDVRWQEDPLTLATEVHLFSMSKVKPAWRGMKFQYGGPDNVAAPVAPPAANADVEDVRNSAGDRWNPGISYEVAMERIEVVFRCSLKWHDTGILNGENAPFTPFKGNWGEYLKRWNATDFTIHQTDPDNPENSTDRTYPAGSLMLIDKRAPLVKEPFYHRLVTCTFLYDPDLWGPRVPDMGPRCLEHLAPNGSGGVTTTPWTTDGKGLGTVTDALGRPFAGAAELDGTGKQMLPDAITGKLKRAVLFQWWPVNENDELLSAEFDDLDLFTRERALNV